MISWSFSFTMSISFQTNGAADFVFTISGSVGTEEIFVADLSVRVVIGPVSRLNSRALMSISEVILLLTRECVLSNRLVEWTGWWMPTLFLLSSYKLILDGYGFKRWTDLLLLTSYLISLISYSAISTFEDSLLLFLWSIMTPITARTRANTDSAPTNIIVV